MNSSVDDLKNRLVNVVSSSLLAEPKFDKAEDPRTALIVALVKELSEYEPEFILKLALYVRDDLNIRSTANFLLAMCSNIPACTPFIRKYYSKIIRLPSDWLDVAGLYQILPDRSLSNRALPTALRKAMVEKFPEFDSYQLGKYNKENSAKKKRRKAREQAEKLREEGIEPPPLPEKKLTIKQMVRQLHIARPTAHVMCVLGKKYPSTKEEFVKSGLAGEFDSTRSGTRMKLPVAETWETMVSSKGNKASTWEELIDHRKLPFMAALRNLRNMILAGISPKHHRWVLSRLTNEQVIANSRQFPFAFFSAYEAINIDLDQLRESVEQAKKAPSEQPKKKARHIPGSNSNTKAVIIPAHMPDQALLAKYREALDTAVKFATVHNIKPIRGTTLVLCSASNSMRSEGLTKRAMGSVRKLCEIGMLMGLMCKYMCEECDFRLFASSLSTDKPAHLSVDLRDGTILDNMNVALEQMNNLGNGFQFPFDLLEEYIRDRKKIDQLIVISDQDIGPGFEEMQSSNQNENISRILTKYRQEVNVDLLYVSINLTGSGLSRPRSGAIVSRNDVMLGGFSDAILRYIAERGDGSQLQYIQHIDLSKQLLIRRKRFAISQKPNSNLDSSTSTMWRFMDATQVCKFEGCGQKVKKEALEAHMRECSFRPVECDSPGCSTIVAYNQLDFHLSKCLFRKLHEAKSGKWRTARVFVSSTFLDMHGERDILTRLVFPELRSRCRSRNINFFEVDLRWGITTEENGDGSSLEACLDQVDKCRPFFIGILGERYGWAPNEYKLSEDPRWDWLRTYPTGRSITELEMVYGALMNPQQSHSFFYIRDSNFIKQIPQEHRHLFETSDQQALNNLNALKQQIRDSVHCFDGYPAQWGGVVDGKPLSTGLKQFANRVLEDLWNAICKVFPETDVKTDWLDDLRQPHENFIESRSRRFVGHQQLTEQLFKFVDSDAIGPLVVHSRPGMGKSSLLAHFCSQMSKKRPGVYVLSHFIGSVAGASTISRTLYRLCHELKREYGFCDQIPDNYQELRLTFDRFIESASRGKPIVLVIDGLDQLDESDNAHSLDWLPSSMPIRCILSTYTGSRSMDALRMRSDELPYLLVGELSPKLRMELARKTLWEFHKKLDESPGNNQMRMLLKKSDSISPLWLTIACEELRLHGVYDTLSTKIRNLSSTIDKLFIDVIVRLETSFGGALIKSLFSLIACSRSGITETEAMYLLARSGEKKLPKAAWISILRGVESILLPLTSDGNGMLGFFHILLKQVVAKRYLSMRDHSLNTHKRLANFYLTQADPNNDGSFNSDTNQHAILDLVYHLAHGRMYDRLESILTNLRFIERKCTLGMVSELISDYHIALMIAGDNLPSGRALLESYLHFVSSSSHILADHPNLCFQQAANQPSQHAASQQAQSMWKGKLYHNPWINWLNKPSTSDACAMTLASNSDAMTASAFSPDGRRMACASRDRTIKVVDAHTGAEQLSLVGHTNWVVACAWSPDGSLIASGSWDDSVRIWDARLGTLIRTLSGHSRRVSSVTFSPDGQKLLSSSWDCTCKLWHVTTGELIVTLSAHTKPINTCTFNSDGSQIASGSWDGSIRIWDQTGLCLATLNGHSNSIRCVAFAPNGQWLASCASDAITNLWDLQRSSVITSFKGHSKPVTCCSFDPTGRLLATSSEDQTVKIWDIYGGIQVSCISTSPVARLNSIAISKDGKRIVTAAADCTLTVWDTLSTTALSTLHDHTQSLTMCKYSPDGRFIVSASEDGTCRVYSNSAQLLATLNQHHAAIRVIAFSKDSKYLITGGDDLTAIVWQTSDWSLLLTLPAHSSSVLCADFSPNGKYVITGTRDGCLNIFDHLTGSLKKQVKAHADWITCCSFSPDGRRLLTTSWDFNSKIWDTRNLSEIHVLRGHHGAVNGGSWSPDNQRVVTCSSDSTLRLWNAVDGYCITPMEGHTTRVNACDWTSEAHTIVSCADDGSIRVWDSTAGTQVAVLLGHAGAVTSCRFAPDRPALVSSSEDRTVKVWETKSNRQLPGHSQAITKLTYSSDANLLLSSSRDSTATAWNTNQFRKTCILSGSHTSAINSCCFITTDGTKAMTVADDSKAVAWDLSQGTEIKSQTAHKKPVIACCSVPKSQSFVTGSWDSTIKIWSLGSKNQPRTLTGHTDWINDLVFVADDPNKLLSCSHDRTVRVWDTRSSKCSTTFDGHTNWILSCDTVDQMVVSACYDGTIGVWDLRRPSQAVRLINDHHSRVNSVALTKDCQHLISVSNDRQVLIHNTSSNNIVGTFVTKGYATATSAANSNDFAVGDSLGNIYFLQLNH